MKFDRSLLPLLLPIGAAAIAATVLVHAFAQDMLPPQFSPEPAAPAKPSAAASASVPAEPGPVAANQAQAQPPAVKPAEPSSETKPVIPPARVPAPAAAAQAPAVPAPNPEAPPPAAPTPAAAKLSQAELDQLVAPIALYPDQLLSQILMASAYPVEIAEAARWVNVPANRALKGDALMAALREKQWKPAVMALVPFPQVLEQLCAQIEWTQKIGSAFLAQQAELMDSVQRLRHEAIAAGHFKTGPQCKCIVAERDGYVTVAPAEPRMVYVPVYDPVWVYGPWPYPLYPPVAFPVPVGFAYAPGFFIGYWGGVDVAFYGPLWGWGRFAWSSHNVFIDPVRVRAFAGGAAFAARFGGVRAAAAAGIPLARVGHGGAFRAAVMAGDRPARMGRGGPTRGAVFSAQRGGGPRGRAFGGPRPAGFGPGPGRGFHGGGPVHLAFGGGGPGHGGGGHGHHH